MGGCKIALTIQCNWRYNWRHDSILPVPSDFIKTAKNIKIHCDIEGYMNPSVTHHRSRKSSWHNCNSEWVNDLCSWVGFETNIDLNTKRKANKYKEMLKSLQNKFEKGSFINLSVGALGLAEVHSNVTNMLNNMFPTTENIIYD